jgi:hypothetical protein
MVNQSGIPVAIARLASLVLWTLKLLKIPLGATLSIVEDLQRNWKDLEASTRKLKVGKSKAW